MTKTLEVLCPTCGSLLGLKSATIGSLWRGRCATCRVSLHVDGSDVVRFVAKHGTERPATVRFVHTVNIDPTRDTLLGSLGSGLYTLVSRNLSRCRVLAEAGACGAVAVRDRIRGTF